MSRRLRRSQANPQNARTNAMALVVQRTEQGVQEESMLSCGSGDLSVVALLAVAVIGQACAAGNANSRRAAVSSPDRVSNVAEDPVPDVSPSEPASPSPVDATSEDLRRRARAQLDVLGLELERVALRLEDEGTPTQRARWIPELIDIDHDRLVLSQSLGELERAHHQEFADPGPIVAMIDVLSALAARATIEIDGALDGHGSDGHSSDMRPAPQVME
jgi:hypothetical protein